MYIQPRYRRIKIYIGKVGFKMISSSFVPSKLTEIAFFDVFVHFLPILVP